MSVGISIEAFSGKDSEEFNKHYSAVEFCVMNGLSFPKETTEFFKGRVSDGNLEDFRNDCLLELIENGVSVNTDNFLIRIDYERYKIKVKDIPKEVDEIIIKLS